VAGAEAGHTAGVPQSGRPEVPDAPPISEIAQRPALEEEVGEAAADVAAAERLAAGTETGAPPVETPEVPETEEFKERPEEGEGKRPPPPSPQR
jgi:hypothetical protein